MPTHQPSELVNALQMATKQEAAAHLKTICDQLKTSGVLPHSAYRIEKSSPASALDLDVYLDSIMESDSSGLGDEQLTKCKWAMAGGRTPQEFRDVVNSFDSAARCGAVWEASSVAYRCRTCSFNPCMSLCVDCFKAGNHEGHDFNRFWSQAGGACDCGDEMVMSDEGFCPRHGSKSQMGAPVPPEDLVTVAEYLMPKLVVRLLLTLRQQYRIVSSGTLNSENIKSITDSCVKIVDFLQECADMGGPMRQLLAQVLTSDDLYERVQTRDKLLETSYDRFTAVLDWRSYSAFNYATRSVESICTASDAQDLDCDSLNQLPKYSSILTEITFWLVRLSFPQKLVTFVLSLLPEDQYKIWFALTFFEHYGRTAWLLTQSQACEDNMANRVIHISVQILSSQTLCGFLVDRLKLTRVLVACVRAMLRNCLVKSPLGGANGTHMVVNCEAHLMEHHYYWSVISDLHNVMGHKSLAQQFLADNVALDVWFQFLTSMQGMNVNVRRVSGEHVQFESRAYYWAYTAELEAASLIMWNLVSACGQESHSYLILEVFIKLVSCLESWFDSIALPPEKCYLLEPLELSFHLPLHRYLSSFLIQANKMNIPVPLPSQSLLQLLVLHPLRIQAGRAEIAANMWVRNGHGLRYQSCLYVQNHFCSAFSDLDMYLLSVCAASLPPEWLLAVIFENFHLTHWFCEGFGFVCPPTENVLERSEWVTPMLEAALRLTASLVTANINQGLTELEVARLEMVTLLAMGDRTHSQLKSSLPNRGSSQESAETHVESLLEELAEYKDLKFDSGGNTSQGIYVPKPCVWTDLFDPLFTHLRCMQTKEFSQAMDRFEEFVKRSGRYKGEGNVWPPFRLEGIQTRRCLRNVLHSGSLHSIFFVILYKCHNDPSTVSEQILYLCIYLLHLAVLQPASQQTQEPRQTFAGLSMQNLFGFYPTDSLEQNLSHHVVLLADQENGDSLISLAVKIHHRLYSAQTNKQQTQWQPIGEKSQERVGDGLLFISQLLRDINDLGGESRREMDRVMGKLGRVKKESQTLEQEEAAKKDARKKANKERQQRLMAQFSNKQKQIMDKFLQQEAKTIDLPVQTTESEKSEEKMELESECEIVTEEIYQCVICNTASPASKDNPIGIIICCVRTVLGKMLPEGENVINLMETDGSLVELKTRDWHEANKLKLLQRYFEKESCMRNTTDCWKGVVKVRTCGHYIHSNCHQSYLKTLVNEQQSNVYVVDEEFLCPLCRQLSNAILPVMPPVNSTEKSEEEAAVDLNFEGKVAGMGQALAHRYGRFPSMLCPLTRKLSKFVDTCMFWSGKDSNPHSLLRNIGEENRDRFIVSLLRTNLELESMFHEQRSASSREKLAISSLIPALSERLAVSSPVVVAAMRDWELLSGQDNLCVSVSRGDRCHNPVPLLLRDLVGAMLRLDLVLLSEPSTVQDRARAMLDAVYQLCLNGRLAQTCISVFLRAPESLRLHWQAQSTNASAALDQPVSIFYQLVTRLSAWGIDETDLSDNVQTMHLDESSSDAELTEQLEQLCLPLAQVQALFLHHLNLAPIRDFDILKRFDTCHKHLTSDYEGNRWLRWPFSNSLYFLSSWSDEIATAATNAPTLTTILSAPVRWQQPQLVRLPESFDVFFERFLRVACHRCHKVPRESVVCLVCGTLVCHRDVCCNRRGKFEPEIHASDCGNGSALFLSVTSTMVYVIAGGRLAIWGSIYLDKYGEEDRNLKRGKPLFLSERRLRALEEQWRAQNFDNAKLRWILIQNAPQLMEGYHVNY